MTENFEKKLQEINEKAIKTYTEGFQEKYLEGYNNNKKYADLYIDLVLKLIESYDYEREIFDINSIKNDLIEIIGTPEKIVAGIDQEEKMASIKLLYELAPYSSINRIGVPNFTIKENPNFEIIADILKEKNIYLYHQYNVVNEIKFDASGIINTSKIISEKKQTIKIRILKHVIK